LVENTENEELITENTQNIHSESQVNTTNANLDDYFTESRIERDKMYSQMLESYQKILESNNMAETQKQIASQEINNINNKKNAIMICENLIKNKGIKDVVIFINDKSINIIVKESSLTEEKIAQIQNIIQRELNAETDNIHISNIS